MGASIAFYTAFSVLGSSLVWVGARYFRLAASVEAYWLAERQLTVRDEIVTTVATFNGSLNFIGLVGAVYVIGVGGAWTGIILALGIFLWGVLAAKRVRLRQIRTVDDMFATCSNAARRTIAGFYVLRNVMLITVELMGAGLALAVALHVPFSLGIVLSAILVTLYTSLGGLWPVVKSDYVQLALILVAFAALTVAALRAGSLSFVPLSHLDPLGVSGISLAGLLLTCIPLAWTVSPLYDRASAARTPEVASRGIWIGGILLVILIAPTIVIGLASSTSSPMVGNPEIAGLVLPSMFFHPIVAGLIALCILSAISSTADSFMMSASAIAANHLLPQRQNTPERTKVLLSRLSIVVVGAVSAVVAATASSIMSTFLVFMKVVVSTLFVPTIVGLYYQGRLTSLSVIMACWGGFLASIVWITSQTPFGVDPVIPGVLVSALGYVTGSLLHGGQSSNGG